MWIRLPSRTGRSARISSTTPRSWSSTISAEDSEFSTAKPTSGPDEAEVDRDADQPRLGGRGVDLGPLNAVVGEDGDAVAFRQAEAQERVREPAGAPVPLPEAHRALEVGGPGPRAVQAGVDREHLPDGQQLPHAKLLRSLSTVRSGLGVPLTTPGRACSPEVAPCPERDSTASF
jgi:hypothetical protein